MARRERGLDPATYSLNRCRPGRPFGRRFSGEPTTPKGLLRSGIDLRANFQSYQDLFGIRQVADDLASGLRDGANQRRYRKDLVTGSELGLLQQIDNFDPVATRQMFFADAFEIAQRLKRARRLSCHIQAKVILFVRFPRAFASLVTLHTVTARPLGRAPFAGFALTFRLWRMASRSFRIALCSSASSARMAARSFS